MWLKQIFRTKADWLVAGGILVAILGIVTGVALIVNNGRERDSRLSIPRSYDPEIYNASIYYTPPPDSKYPPPAKEQRTFYRTYTEGDIQYNIEKATINGNRSPSNGPNSFYVNLYNHTNKDVTLSGDALNAVTIGCIAEDNPYRATPLEAQPLSFKPFERKQPILSVDVACMYIGTADSKYYWRTY